VHGIEFQRITIGLKWVAASDNLPIRIFVLWESSLRETYYLISLLSRPILVRLRSRSKRRWRSTTHLFFPRLHQSISNRARHVRPSCPKTIHFHRSSPSSSSSTHIRVLFRGKNESNVPVYNRCDRKSMYI